jgi:hypothetical protein
MDLRKTFRKRHLRLAYGRRRQPLPASGGTATASSWHGRHATASLVPDMKIFSCLHFLLDSALRICHNAGHGRNVRGTGPADPSGGPCSDSRTDRRQSELEPAATVRGAVGRMGLAQRKRSVKGHGRTQPAFEARRARTDHSSPATTGSLQPDGCPSDCTEVVGQDACLRNIPIAGSTDRAGDQYGSGGTLRVFHGPDRVSLSGLPGHSRRKPSIHGHGREGASARLPAFWRGGLEMPIPGPVHRLDAGTKRAASFSHHQQHAIPDPAVGPGGTSGQLDPGSGPAATCS